MRSQKILCEYCGQAYEAGINNNICPFCGANGTKKPVSIDILDDLDLHQERCHDFMAEYTAKMEQLNERLKGCRTQKEKLQKGDTSLGYVVTFFFGFIALGLTIMLQSGSIALIAFIFLLFLFCLQTLR